MADRGTIYWIVGFMLVLYLFVPAFKGSIDNILGDILPSSGTPEDEQAHEPETEVPPLKDAFGLEHEKTYYQEDVTAPNYGKIFATGLLWFMVVIGVVFIVIIIVYPELFFGERRGKQIKETIRSLWDWWVSKFEKKEKGEEK